MGTFYIEILDGDRGSVVSTLYPTTFKINKSTNEKESFSGTVPYTDAVTHGDYFYLRNDRDDSAWFYGRVGPISFGVDGDRPVTFFSGYCSMASLSEISVGNLEIFDFGFRSADIVWHIDTTDERDVDEDVLPQIQGGGFTWNIQTASGILETGNNPGIDTLMVGSYVPFLDTKWTLSDGYTSASTHLDGADFKYQLLDNNTNWVEESDPDDTYPYTDQTNKLKNSGSIVPSIDRSGSWEKSYQSGNHMFWRRVWFQRSDFYSNSGEDQSITITDIEINKRIPTSSAISRIAGEAVGWTFPNTVIADDVYHMFAGDSVIEALRLISKMTGGYFKNGSYTSNVVDWVTNSDDGLGSPSITLTNDPSTANGTTQILVLDVKGKYVEPTATRLTLYGAGHGQNRMQAALESISGSFLPAGFTYDAAENLLINTTAETALGRLIHKEVNSPFTSSLFASGQSVEAANQILRQNVRWLEKASRTDRTSYQVVVANNHGPIEVGTVVTLDYTRGSISLSGTFIITKVTSTYGETFSSVLELSDDGFSIEQATGFYTDSLEETRQKAIYRQPIWSGDVEGGRTTLAGSSDPSPILFPDTSTKRPFIGDYLPVPAWIFENEFEPTTAEFDIWLANFDAGAGTFYRYAHAGEGAGAGSMLTPSWVWESNGDGTGTLIQGEAI